MLSSTFVSGLVALGLASAATVPPFPTNGTDSQTTSKTVVAVPAISTSVGTAAAGTGVAAGTGASAGTPTYAVTGAPDVTVVTDTVTALTTVCPSATDIVQNGRTYHVTKSTTLTITDCPCTVHRTVPVSAATPAPSHVWNNGTNANATVYWTTETVNTVTVTCPNPTTIVTNGHTIPVPKPTTLTISDACPCQTTRPVTVVSAAGVPPSPVATHPADSTHPAAGAPPTSAAPVASSSASKAPPAPSQPIIATGAAAGVTAGSGIMAWIAAAAFAMVA